MLNQISHQICTPGILNTIYVTSIDFSTGTNQHYITLPISNSYNFIKCSISISDPNYTSNNTTKPANQKFYECYTCIMDYSINFSYSLDLSSNRFIESEGAESIKLILARGANRQINIMLKGYYTNVAYWNPCKTPAKFDFIFEIYNMLKLPDPS